MKQVCLDPGHGPACPNKSPDRTYEEQEFAFDLSNRIKSILVQQGVQVTMTRDASGYPGLTERCEIANKTKDLDLFVSIHSNASGEGGWSTPSGHMIYTSQPDESAARNKAARCIIHALQAAGVSVRGDGLMHNDYTVLSATTAPAVLIEHGFHTNRADVAQLKTDAFRTKLANADAEGILDFLGIDWKDTSDRSRVQARFDLDDNTMAFLDHHPYTADLYRKLSDRM